MSTDERADQRADQREDEGADGHRWPRCRCGRCFTERVCPAATTRSARVGLALAGGAAAVVVLLGW